MTPTLINIAVVLTGVGIVLHGRHMSADKPTWPANASVTRASIEVTLLALGILGLSASTILLGQLDHQAATGVQFVAVLLLVFAPASVATSRLRPPPASNGYQYVATYIRAAVSFTVVVFLSSFLGLLFVDTLLQSLLLAAAIAVAFLIFFAMLRSMSEVVRLSRERSLAPLRPGTTPAPHPSRVKYAYLHVAIWLALGLWVVAYVVYFNREIRPSWSYTPPLYSSTLSTAIPIPLDRPLWPTLATTLPSVLILLIALFGARSRIPREAAVLFVLLALLYSLWGLDIYPLWGGPLVYASHLTAWSLIAPVQIHWATIFPEHILDRHQEGVSTWWWTQRVLYAAFAVQVSLMILFHMQTASELQATLQSQISLAPLVLIVGRVGLQAVPAAALVSLSLLEDSLQRAAGFKDPPPTEGAGCTWLDSFESVREEGTATKSARTKQQLRWVMIGVTSAAVIYVLWFLLLFPGIMPVLGGWSVWSQAVARWAHLAFFLAVIMAIRQLRLWDVERIAVDAIAWLAFLSAGIMGVAVFRHWLGGGMVSITGLLGIAVLSGVGAFDWWTGRIYGWIWKEKGGWHGNLQKVERLLATRRESPLDMKAVVEDSLPIRASAAWLLRPRMEGTPLFDVEDVGHDATCGGACRGHLHDVLSEGPLTGSDGILLPQSLHALLVWSSGAGRRGRPKAVMVQRLVAREPWEGRIAERLLGEPSLDEATVERLARTNLALIVPFGERAGVGILLVGTDRYGDYYDGRDQLHLSEWAHSISVASRRPRNPTVRTVTDEPTGDGLLEINASELKASIAFWDFLLRALDFEPFQEWSEGRSWRKADFYVVVVQAPQEYLGLGAFHRRSPGLNHVAFRVGSREKVDELLHKCRDRGIVVLYEERHPFAGGPDHYAIFIEDPERLKVEIVAAPRE